MLDFGYVRANLALVEEKLRARGADPAIVLGDFVQIDQARRSLITQAETIKAERNRLTTQFAELRKAGAAGV